MGGWGLQSLSSYEVMGKTQDVLAESYNTIIKKGFLTAPFYR